MVEQTELSRFIEAQKTTYSEALREIKSGKKQGHWMWFIFPQMRGLGASSMSHFYGIKDLAEAKNYLEHPLLGTWLREICAALMNLESRNAHEIFGSPDDLKLRSCMTLFAAADKGEIIFQKVLDEFFAGQHDKKH